VSNLSGSQSKALSTPHRADDIWAAIRRLRAQVENMEREIKVVRQIGQRMERRDYRQMAKLPPSPESYPSSADGSKINLPLELFGGT